MQIVTVRFGACVLDTRARRLLCDGRPAHLSTKAFDLLVLLVERRPAVVEKATLRDHLWPGVHVGEASLSNLIIEIRAALHEGGAAALVRTVHRVGYAFDGEVVDEAAAVVAREPSSARCWLVWQERRLGLVIGDNLIGRDKACAVWIDADDVSRRHAKICVNAAGRAATIEDLGSTNGTFVAGRRISAEASLENGTLIRLGRERVTFRSDDGAHAATRRIGRQRRG
jgi:DNA-binding winged helix-turn-helix (wHTH) protein